MRLEIYLRERFYNKIRPLYLKDKCEHCDSTQNLHLHHVEPSFKSIVEETLIVLNIPLKDSEEYNEQELFQIECYFLGRHLYTEYATLCQECHIEEHKRLHEQKVGVKNNKESKKETKINKKEMERQRKRMKVLDVYVGKKLDEIEFINLIKELYPTSRKKSAIRLMDELGYNVKTETIKMNGWKTVKYIISKKD